VLDTEYPNFRNIINKIESPINQPVREKTVLSDEEVQEILQMLIERKKYEMACFVALAAYGGRRKSEICRFKVSDFSEDKLVCGGSLWRSSPMRTKGRGVQGKILQVYTLVKPFKPYLDLWLTEREQRGVESQWLFPDDLNPSEMMPVSTVNSWMNTLSRLTGKDIYCHMFRHRYTTYLSDNGIPDAVIKEIQGWSDLTMVGVYVDRSTEDTLDMYFNEDGFKNVEVRGLSEL
jgi:integrase